MKVEISVPEVVGSITAMPPIAELLHQTGLAKQQLEFLRTVKIN